MGHSLPWPKLPTSGSQWSAPQPGDVFKFSLQRADLKVTADGVAVKPGLALGSWVGFKKMGAQATAMGDLVLTESEAGTVMTKLQQGGIEQTTVHNHLLHETPRVMYMHIRGEGDPVKLAEALRRWR